jgi:hypothetical protein
LILRAVEIERVFNYILDDERSYVIEWNASGEDSRFGAFAGGSRAR